MKKQLPIFNRNSWQLKKLPKAIHRISHNRKSKIVNLKSQSGFTLVELMVVIGIIIVIAASVLTILPGMREKAQEKATWTFMEHLEIAIERYYDDNRSYPLTGTEPTAIEDLKMALQPSEDTSKRYIEFKDDYLDDNIIIDKWGNPFVYIQPGTKNTTTYDLYSTGSDGTSTSSGDDTDDINNWSR